MEDPFDLDFEFTEDSINQFYIEDQAPSPNTDVLLVTIEIGDGKLFDLKVKEDDDPFKIAHDFGNKHRLDVEQQRALAAHIMENIVKQTGGLPSPSMDSIESSAIDDSMKTPRHQTKNSGAICIEEQPGYKPKINDRSRQIIASKQLQGPAYERLYSRRKRPVKSKSQANLTTSILPPKTNRCSMIYLKQVKEREKQNKSIELKRAQLEKAKLSECTHMPKTNNRRTVSIALGNTENILLAKGKEIQQKLEFQRLENEAQTQSTCPFKPQINRKSAKMVAAKSKRSVDLTAPHYEHLHAQHKESQSKLENLVEKTMKLTCTFHPQTRSSASSMTAHGMENSFSTTELISRLTSPNKEEAEKIEAIRESLKVKTYDEATGQPLFQPQISRGPRTPREGSKPVWQQLYDEHQKKSENDAAKEQDRTWQDRTLRSQTTTLSDMSANVYNEFKTKRIRKYFDSLDKDGTGQVILNSQNVSMFSDEADNLIQIALGPRNQTMAYAEFENAINDYLDSLPYADRVKILKRSPRQVLKEQTGTPSINKRSAKLASPRVKEPIYERRKAEAANTAQKIRQTRQRRLEQESKECTFTPDVLGIRQPYQEEPVFERLQTKQKSRRIQLTLI